MFKFATPTCALALLLAGACAANCDSIFVETDIVSDVPGLAPVTDPNLKNPWGVSFSATSPFWTSNAGSNTSTLYAANGTPNAMVVAVAGSPTGQINNGSGTGFLVAGTSARFIFDTLGGTIQGWTGGNAAVVEASKAGAAYTGLAFGSVNGANFLYAANFAQNSIDVYNSSWASTTLPGNFTDPNLPSGYRPFNIQSINGNLYVEYAQAGTGPMSPGRGAGLGVVDIYSPSGVLLQTLIGLGGQLNAPWGVTLAPAGFGAFGGDLLVGNFGDGQINAFNPTTGAFLGTIDGSNGNPLANSNLWALETRTAAGFDNNGVYITAGINGQTDGLFSVIDAAPEPGTFSMLALGTGAVAAWLLRRRRPDLRNPPFPG
jgi:uncharacterized protein (TIGR03118 family)